jgi:putative spermidine/putrescine transport system permease protein
VRGRTGAGRIAWLGMLPFLLYMAVFLGLPLYVVVHGALTSGGHFTLSNFSAIFSQSQYLTPLKNSLILALWTSLGPAILGLGIAAAVIAGPADGLLRRVVSSASGVFAYFAGAPLAFVWVAALGTLGVITVFFKSAFGYDLSQHFDISSQAGVGICYFYFQIPLMVIFITPALEGLKPEWEEAARNLGARRRDYIRHVAAPVLAPSFIAATLILFGSSFSAFATMLALDGCTQTVVPCKVNLEMSNNVLTNSIPLGLALGTEMILVVGIVMIGYWYVQRRAGRWLR